MIERVSRELQPPGWDTSVDVQRRWEDIEGYEDAVSEEYYDAGAEKVMKVRWEVPAQMGS